MDTKSLPTRSNFIVAPHVGGEVFWIKRLTPDSTGYSGRNFHGDRSEAATVAQLDRILSGPRCVECNDPILWDENMMNFGKLLQRGVCFSCNFWLELLSVRDDSQSVRVNGSHYRIANDLPDHLSASAGHGGARFKICFHDGSEAVTTNLWAQGTIPSHFASRLPDNATFVKEAGPLFRNGYVGFGSAQ